MEETRQITILFDSDHPGSLAGVTGILSRHAVNIFAMIATGNRKDGSAHIVVDHTDLAYNILKNHGYRVMLEEVLCLPVLNVAGALHRSLQVLAEHEINIDYIYAFAKDAAGMAVMKCDNASHAKNALTAYMKNLR